MSSRKQPEESSRAAEELALVLDALPAIVASFDEDGRLLYLNAFGCERLRRFGSELAGVLLSDLLSEATAERLLRDALPEAARTGRWDGEGDLVPREGEAIFVELNLLRHPPGGGKRLALTLVAHPVETLGRDSGLSSFGFLHDLNNLLGPVLAYATLARDETPEESAAHRHLTQLLHAAKRARALAEGALRRTRPRPESSPRVTLADLVREVADWLRAEHPRVEVAIEHPLSSQTIEGDALELERMLLNLCRNAAESLPPEGGRVSLALREIGPPRELRLTVRDNGRGMDEAALGRIFEPFYSTKPGGTGIGLSAAREVVRRHRGTIMVESSPGEGTSFHVRLPLEDG